MTIAAVDHAALSTACSAAGLDSSSLSLLHRHATSVYLLASAAVVARVSRGEDRRRARTAVTAVRWLVDQGFPATAPLDTAQPVDVGDTVVTFWRYYPQNGRPSPEPAALGAILRQLHQLSAPPVALRRYQPLARLGTVLAGPTRLPEAEREWLYQRRAELLADYDQLRSTLGVGFIHGDAYPGNMLWDGDKAILGDWDEVANGPRELDLVNTHHGARLGRGASQREAFTAAYGWDVTTWSGFPTLRAIRDLHTLAAYIERSNAGDGPATAELQHRVTSLLRGDVTAQWRTT